MDFIFYDDVFTSLNCNFSTRATDRELGKEFLMVLFNRACPVVGWLCNIVSTQRVGKAYNREPRTTFSISQLDDVLFFIFKIQKVVLFLKVYCK